MKTLLLFVLGLFMFYSCGSENNKDYTEYYKQQLKDQYDSLLKDASVAEHLALIDEFKERSILDCKKDVFVDAKLEQLNLAVSSRDSSMFYFVSADKQVDEILLKFQHEIKLKDIRHVVENTFESLPSNFRATTSGVLNFKNATTAMLSEIANNQIIVVFRTIDKVMPAFMGDKFMSGEYHGRILMYHSKSKNLVANLDVFARSSDVVMVNRTQESGLINTDFVDRINSAYLAALQSKFLAIDIPTLAR